MIDRAMAVAAIAVLFAFLGILVWKVPSLDLAAVVALTLLLVVWDFLSSSGRLSRQRQAAPAGVIDTRTDPEPGTR